MARIPFNKDAPWYLVVPLRLAIVGSFVLIFAGLLQVIFGGILEIVSTAQEIGGTFRGGTDAIRRYYESSTAVPAQAQPDGASVDRQIPNAHHSGLTWIFKGLDLLFVAPMATMIIYALYALAETVMDPSRYSAAKQRLSDAKVIVLGLLATAVAVHLVEKIVTGSVIPPGEAVAYIGGILVVGGYALLLERSHAQ